MDAQQRGPRRRGHREGRRRSLGSAAELLDACTGTGASWNSTTRLLDSFRLLSAPETGISIDASVVNCLSPGLAESGGSARLLCVDDYVAQVVTGGGIESSATGNQAQLRVGGGPVNGLRREAILQVHLD
jgi:hypothetical protein